MRLRRLTAFLLLCTFSFQQVTFASGGLVTGVLEMAQHFSPEGAPAGFEIYLDEGLREEIVLNRNDGALQSVVETVIENQEPEALPQNHISWLKAIDLKRHEIADNADQAIDKVFDYIKPEADSLTEEILFLPQTASAEVLRLIAKGFVDVLRTGDLLDEIWDDAQGAWRDVHDGNLSDAGKKLLSLSGNTFIEVSRVLDLALIGGGIRALGQAGTGVLQEGIAKLVGKLLRTANSEDLVKLRGLFKNSWIEKQFLKEVDNIHDLRRAADQGLLDYNKVKSKSLVRDAAEVNKGYPDFYNPKPHKPGRPVAEFVRSGTDLKSEQLVRVHNEGNVARSWLMKKSEFEAIKQEAQASGRDFGSLLQKRLALQNKPTHVSDFIPPDDKLLSVRRSTVNPVSPNDPEVIQYELLTEGEQLLEAWFRNGRNL